MAETVSQEIERVCTGVSTFITDFHNAFAAEVYNSGHPDERGITDQLLYKIAIGVSLNMKSTFTAGKVESIEGHDYIIKFSQKTPNNTGGNMEIEHQYTLFLQAKNMQREPDGTWWADFTAGIGKKNVYGQPLGAQIDKLHKKITDVIKEKEGADEVHINGGYVLYGPSTLGIIYAPIGLVKKSFAKYYKKASSLEVCKQMTAEIVDKPQERQFCTILTDHTTVPPYVQSCIE